ncbi:Lon protease C-terminal proteolytic domain-containing protein [Lactarius deliciosus]|nr:Lon protease C-terminal proteolytic domain-containing protein [Lactarius deliciosus]
MEYLAVVRLRALIAQEAGTEQAKAQEVTLKKVIVDPAAGASEADGQKENACRALIKAGEIPALPQVPVPVPTPQSLSKAKGIKPSILLFNGRNNGRDEIDKVGQSNYHGDPSAALLEILDPEQNDHYLNVPIDLSQTHFICTAKSLGTISPLLSIGDSIVWDHTKKNGDQWEYMSVVRSKHRTTNICIGTGKLGVHDEKLHVARRFLLLKQLAQNGLSEPHVQLTARATQSGYALHARGGTSETSDALVKRSKDGDAGYNPVVEADELEKILDLSRYDGKDREKVARRRVVWGLVVTGSIATPGSGHLKLTGSLGDVINESVEPGLSWVKTHSYDLGITSKRAQDPLRIPEAMIDVHPHLPAGAQKKDGPSAGVAMREIEQVCAMASLLTGKCVPPTTAMTGEITLRGRVSPEGGVKEKVLGAHRAGANKEVRAWMQFVITRTVCEVLDAAFGEGALPWRMPVLTPVVESRLL